MISKKAITFSVLIAVILLATGCAGTKTVLVTRESAFPEIYNELPQSIAVLPPINNSPTPEATIYYEATIETPLSSKGYDILPPDAVTKIAEQKGIHDTKELYDMPLERLSEYVDSDAVLYTHIQQWREAHTGMISRLIISIDTELISLKTEKQLWIYNSSLNVDLNTVKTGGGSLLLIIEGMETDVDKETEESIAHTLRATTKLTQDLPFGPSHKDYLQDQQVGLIGSPPQDSLEQ